MKVNPVWIYGTDTNDVVSGTIDDDTIFGMMGGDILKGLGGNDTIDGGAGIDTVYFNGPRAEYTFERTATGVTVHGFDKIATDNADGTVAITLVPTTSVCTNVERLAFQDVLYATDTNVGGHVWQVGVLFTCAGITIPDMKTGAQWLMAADRLDNMGALAQEIINTYARGATNQQVVSFLYSKLTHGAVAPSFVVDQYAALIGPGKMFPTQGDLYAAAANLPTFTEAGTVLGLVGSVQQLNTADMGIL